MNHWHNHPAVPTGDCLTLGERAADRMRNGFGSWAFIGSTLGFIALWIVAVDLGAGIDNKQLTILNLVLSCFAALQGAIILLAAKRADKISSQVALHTSGNSDELLAMNRQQLEILQTLRRVESKLDDGGVA